ncbi:MAG: molybdenum ABC transporter ATP-binding protein [Alphaproteobacteria bacterium PA4]|nr:MAG: molybdenum ABC transporter ATP-binding protein [Alphaproteobacteria bacterium PA4]
MSVNVAITLTRGDFHRDFHVESDARVTALVGPSGCGKTSLLLAIAGLAQPERGHIRIGNATLFDSAAGITVPPARRRLGILFQDTRLFPHLNVAANLGYARPGDHDAVIAMAGRLGIAALLDRWPRHLSGGEARRVALGRALLARPAALLLDEPLAHLDPPRAADLLDLIADIAEVPIVYVTHELAEAERLGATVVSLAG